MPSPLVEYLRNAAQAIDEYYPDLSSIRDQIESSRLREAADEIERLRAVLQEIRRGQ